MSNVDLFVNINNKPVRGTYPVGNASIDIVMSVLNVIGTNMVNMILIHHIERKRK